MFEDATFAEILDDLASRFIINVPEEELQEIERICFQIEQAHWFYEDFIREENQTLPSMSLKTFAGRMFKHCPLLSQWANNPNEAYQTFLEYKFKVPVCGAIILNPMLDKVLLVKGWSSRSSWGFPRGKINKDEPEWQCAQREVVEETGFDILPYLLEQDRIEITQADQKVLLYIITGISEDTSFVPTVRKEISQVQWHYIDDLPCGGRPDRRNGSNVNGMPAKSEKEHRYYLIKPFVKRIKTWVARHPERVGMMAAVVNAQGQAPAAPAPYNDENVQRGDVSAVRLPGSGVMSVQELFQTVNRATSPHASTAAYSQQTASRIPFQATTSGLFQAANASQPYANQAIPVAHASDTGHATTSLLQTLMGGSSGPPAVNGGSNSGFEPEPPQPVANDKLAALANLMRRTGITATPPPQQHAVFGGGSPDGQAGQVMSTAQHFGGSRPTSTVNAGDGAGLSLQGFAFDTRSIMNAFTNTKT